MNAQQLSLGLCCINTVLRKQRIFCSRTCVRKNFTVEKAQELALQNVRDITKLLEWNHQNGIRCLRLSSDIFPHFTDPETTPYTLDFAAEELRAAGALAKTLKHRIVMHPGQYNQIASPDERVFRKTVADLSHHADILDTMGIDYNGVLIVHGGGSYGDKDQTIRRWIERFHQLPEKVKSRLVLENCERQYSTEDCLYIAEECGIPVVFDFHHYHCYSQLHPDDEQENIADLIPDIVATWGDRIPLMHISEQGEGRVGHHSDYISSIPIELIEYLDDNPHVHVDLEVEAKAKEQAILRLYKEYPTLKPK